jgi:high-affinity Fe2+/Pb2+ permease
MSHHVWAIVATSLVAIAAVIALVVFLRARKRGSTFHRLSITIVLVAAIMASGAVRKQPDHRM